MASNQVRFVLIALIAIGIGVVVARLVSAVPQEQVLTGVQLLTADVIDRVVMRDREDETVVEKIGDQWMVGPYPVLPEQLQDMWDAAGRIDGAGLISENPANHTLMGASTANGTVVQFWSGEELREEFVIGDKEYAPLIEEEKPLWPWSALVLLCYVRPVDRNEVYGVYCPFPLPFNADPDRWRNPIISALPPDGVASISFGYRRAPFELSTFGGAWVVTFDGEQQDAVPEVVTELLQDLELLVTSGFPTEEEVKRLDFSDPDVTMRISPIAAVGVAPITLLFIEKEGEDFAYFVKNAANDYVHFLDERDADLVLKSRADLTPAAEAVPPTPTPGPSG